MTVLNIQLVIDHLVAPWNINKHELLAEEVRDGGEQVTAGEGRKGSVWIVGSNKHIIGFSHGSHSLHLRRATASCNIGHDDVCDSFFKDGSDAIARIVPFSNANGNCRIYALPQEA